MARYFVFWRLKGSPAIPEDAPLEEIILLGGVVRMASTDNPEWVPEDLRGYAPEQLELSVVDTSGTWWERTKAFFGFT